MELKSQQFSSSITKQAFCKAEENRNTCKTFFSHVVTVTIVMNSSSTITNATSCNSHVVLTHLYNN